MEYEERFTDAELGKIIEQAMMYICACPVQVASGVRNLRELYRYQLQCITNRENNIVVHKLIAQSTIQAHAILESCLDNVIDVEKWDRSTLEMPADLRKRQIQDMLSDTQGN